MKSFLCSLIFCLAAVFAANAQVTDTTVCDILANPQSFDGKIVRVKGTVVAGFDEFVIRDASCKQPVNAIWLAYPAGTKAKAGPLAFVQIQLSRNNTAAAPNVNRAPVTLDKGGKDFKQFDSLVSTIYKHGVCLGCNRYTVTATMVGRLDGVKKAGLVRDSAGKVTGVDGFGNLNQYTARLVLQSVSDVASQEINYSKLATVKDEVNDPSINAQGGDRDPVAGVHKAAKGFGPGTPTGDLLERAANAYGKKGDDNGVTIGFGIPNEVPKNDSVKGDHDSPDGLVFNCTFNLDRLKGPALTDAITHVGSEIADLRDPQSTATSLYDLEGRAWTASVLSSVASQQRTLIAPGGYVMWNFEWSDADRMKNMNEAVVNFLTDWMAVSK